MYKKGFSLLELIVVMGLLVLFTTLVADFQAKVFIYNRIFQDANVTLVDAVSVLKSMTAELRSMSPSSAGGYPIDTAATSTITFYNDINDDGGKEKIRYFMSGMILKKGIIQPSGNPVIYNSASETVSTLINNVRNTATTSIFNYYDNSYYGQATATPLTFPLDIQQVRLININLVVDPNPNRPLAPITETTNVTLRNLKDNL